jgi:hypothetical protein
MDGEMIDTVEGLMQSADLDVVLSQRLCGNEFVTLHYDNSQKEWVVMCWMKRITTNDIFVALDEFITIAEQMGEK